MQLGLLFDPTDTGWTTIGEFENFFAKCLKSQELEGMAIKSYGVGKQRTIEITRTLHPIIKIPEPKKEKETKPVNAADRLKKMAGQKITRKQEATGTQKIKDLLSMGKKDPKPRGRKPLTRSQKMFKSLGVKK